ncbi:unnamed protein product [Peniophora sp. CBMAI 1063]|nr:unnamed protein product [Peniophora sp. CBMAI 1063]
MPEPPSSEVIEISDDDAASDDRPPSPNSSEWMSDSDVEIPDDPPIGPPVGDEDNESDENMGQGPSIVARESTAPPLLSDVARTVDGELRMPLVERHPYVMNHAQFSPPLMVKVPVPEPFSKAGLQDSDHFHQWLGHLAGDDGVESPPYSEELSDRDRDLYGRITDNVRREACNLRLLQKLLATTECEILELQRTKFILARAATHPLMRAAALAQGVDLEIPAWLRRRASAPLPRSGFQPDGRAPPAAAAKGKKSVNLRSPATNTVSPSPVAGPSPSGRPHVGPGGGNHDRRKQQGAVYVNAGSPVNFLETSDHLQHPLAGPSKPEALEGCTSGVPTSLGPVPSEGRAGGRRQRSDSAGSDIVEVPPPKRSRM